MKNFSLFIALVLIVSLFTACGTENTADTADTADTTETSNTTSVETTAKEEAVVRIAIDKSTLADADSFIQSMKDYGAEVNDISGADGYLLVFSKSEHEKLIQDKYAEAIKKFKEYEENEEHYVDSVEYDEDFRNLKIYVDKDMYDTTASTTSDIVVAAVALSYQLYLEDGQKTYVKVIYSGTEDVVSAFSLPINLSVAQ